ncbi:hypothetical protein HPP92_024894 [Vanilla planifolia]|uniref:Uncharacterized protein n=1 Tax=Vanilla planifolia TaxID=51239 RepID=A0A835UBL1_VANPL|nr:hypothetical protein HPP92_024894 [Vanilla planifolia]
MDDEGLTKELLQNRIVQLEHERDELRKDIEQLCMQQAGPSYLAVATRMHFQRTTGLEQEIESLKKNLAGCLREKQNLEEELSEAYKIKMQLSDLHNAEVLKNKEVEGQLKFFQGCIASALSERDYSIMECERAKEREEAISQKLNFSNKRVEELELAYHYEKEQNASLVKELNELKEKIEIFNKVIDKFCMIRDRDGGSSVHDAWQSMCSCLLDDSPDRWTFDNNNRSTTLAYIASLEEELDSQKQAMEKMQSNLRMGLQIEQHLKRNARLHEKKQLQLIKMFESGISSLHHIHSQQRIEIMKILDGEMSYMKALLLEFQERLNQFLMSCEQKHNVPVVEAKHLSGDNDFKDGNVIDAIDSSIICEEIDTPLSTVIERRIPDVSDALSQALHEKVAALLLLSQQEERHLLEREMNIAMQNKMEELQQNLSQVMKEKMEALMELAQLKREYQILRDNHFKYGDLSHEVFEKPTCIREREGTFKNFLRKTSLKNWIGASYGQQDNVKVTSECNIANENYSMDLARLKVDNAALRENILNVEQLTSSVHRLHALLLKVQNDFDATGSFSECLIESLSNIIAEAKQLKTVINSSLPVSCSADAMVDAHIYKGLCESEGSSEKQRSHNVLCTAGLEMVELLILSAQLLKGKAAGKACSL